MEAAKLTNLLGFRSLRFLVRRGFATIYAEPPGTVTTRRHVNKVGRDTAEIDPFEMALL